MNNQTKEVSPTENYPGTQNPGQSSKLVQEYKRKYIEGSNPFLHAGIISRTFYGWMNPILRFSNQEVLKQDQLYPLRPIDQSENSYERLKKQFISKYPDWKVDPGTKTSAWDIIRMMVVTYPWYFFLYFLSSVAFSIMDFFNAKIMNLALKGMEKIPPGASFDQKMEIAGKLVLALVFSDLALTVLKSQNNFIISLVTRRIRNGLNALIFEKVSKKSLKRDTTFSIGDVVNITQTDTNRISNISSAANMIFISPFEITAGMIWMFNIVGWKCMTWGILFLAISVVVNIYISSMFMEFRAKFLHARDKRGKLVGEVFGNIRYIKMAGLENYFLDRILEVKDEELKWIEKNLFRRIYSIVINQSVPVLFLASVFTSYIYYNGYLSVPMIFLVIQVYNIFRSNFRVLPYLINWILDIFISAQRIMFFLLSENVEDDYIKRIGNDENGKDDDDGEINHAIEIENGNFYWDDPGLTKLYKDEKERIAQLKKKRGKKKNWFSKKKGKNNKEENPKEEEKEDPKVAEANKTRTLTRYSLSALNLNEGDFGSLAEKIKSSVKAYKSIDGRSVSAQSRLRVRSELTEDLMGSLLNDPISICNSAYEGINLSLRNINIKIPKGRCVALIGKVGSGKSSLLSCLGGQLYHKIGAKIKLRGSVAYVGQKAWIQSITVKNNILFGKELDKQRYEDSIKYSCMTDDLKILQKKDDTLLGDKGVNLSGGQKIRLSIARAMYSDADIYLFDDPISALDIHVGKYVMEEGILNYLKGSTRVVATHAIAYLKRFDYIYVMDDGEIIEEGTYDEIVETEVYKEIQKTIQQTEEEEKQRQKEAEEAKKEKENNKGPSLVLDELPSATENNKKSDTENQSDQISLRKQAQSDTERTQNQSVILDDIKDAKQRQVIEDIIACEDRKEGNIDFKLIGKWLGLIGGIPNIIFLVIVMSVRMFTDTGIPFFLQWWSSNTSDKESGNIGQFISIYVTISGLGIMCNYIRTSVVFLGNLEMSKEVNFKMTFQLIHASINKFYDRVPLGRILNRFIKDITAVDLSFPNITNRFVFSTFATTANLCAAVLSSTPVNFIFVAVYVYISVKIQRYYMGIQREVTRLRAISSSPVIQAFKEEVEGITTINFFAASKRLFHDYIGKMDEVQKNFIVSTGAGEWFNIWISLLSLIVVIPCVLSSLFFVTTTTGLFGFMLNYLLQTTGKIRTLLSSFGSMETQLISLERCCYFMEVKPEEGYRGLDILESALRRKKDVKLDLKKLVWPSRGKLEIKKLYVKYRQNLPNVLKNINLTIKPGTKVGIVGRTGAGKSTLISALYRTFDEYRGEIKIDGKEIRTIDLKVLRNTMTIIPQDPYLFNDTVRNNMDPTHQFEEEAIKDILKEVKLWDKFAKLNGLDSQIESGGSNLSQGEKQLVCLARALLFKNKVVLMDEATANIDTQTEAIIQRLVKERFNNSTILMIAHRLNTILHCDKVLVLDDGKVLEYDDLDNLKGNEKSHFGRMLMKSEAINESLR